MKLPGIRYGSVQSLGRQDVGAGLRVANALTGATTAALDVYNKIQDAEDERIVRERLLPAREEAAMAYNRATTQPVFDLENPDDRDFVGDAKQSVNLSDGKGGMRSTIDAHEVMMPIWESRKQRISSSAMEGLTDRQKAMFAEKFDPYVSGLDVRMDRDALVAKSKYLRSSALNDAQALVSQGDLEGGLAAIQDSGVFTEQEILGHMGKLTEQYGKQIAENEKDAVRQVILEDNYGDMIQMREALKDPNQFRNIDPKDRVILQNSLRSRINSIEADMKAGQAVKDKALTAQATTMIKALEEGMPLDQQRREQIDMTISALRANGQDAKADQLVSQTMVSERVSAITDLRVENIPAAVDAIAGTMEQGSPEEYVLAQQVRQRAEGYMQRVNTDTPAVAIQEGDLDPIVFSPENFIPTLQQRAQQIQQVGEKKGTMTGYFSEDEMNGLNSMMENMSSAEQLATIDAVQQVLGMDSHKLWSQAKQKDEIGIYSSVGFLTAFDKPNVAQSVMRGNDWLQTNPGYLKDHEREFNQDPAWATLRSAYSNPNEYRSITAAVRAHYADLVQRKGITEYNAEVLESAIENVTGGMTSQEEGFFSRSGSAISNPVPSRPIAEFEEWMDNLEASDIAAMGQLKNYTPEQVVDGIANGTLVARQLSPGNFALVDSEYPTRTVKDVTGAPFRFIYDIETLMRKEAAAQQKQAEKLEAQKEARRTRRRGSRDVEVSF